jgi:monomeric sarcosine oxidase
LIYDAAVIGLGTMGTFASLELARRGLSVVGLDQFAPPHGRGSHSGDTRVFRTAYAEHPDYVPLALRAAVLWRELGLQRGAPLLHSAGMLSLGPPDAPLLAGARESAAAYGLAIENLSHSQVRSRFSVFAIPNAWEGVLESAAGWIDVDAALCYGLESASRAGADLRINTHVEDWSATGDRFAVQTSAGTFMAARLIVTAGAWANRILADLELPLTVLRKILVWIDPLRDCDLPVFASARDFFYGFPNIGGQGVKLGIHWSDGPPAADPDEAQPDVSAAEVRPVIEAAAELLPSLTGPLPDAFGRVLRARSCLYTMTPDEHFVIDRHPEHPNLAFAAGFSGHGFKFAPAIGEVLADLALTGTTVLPVEFLGLSRFRVAGKRGTSKLRE